MSDALEGLVRRAQQGDREALAEVVASQQRYVYSIALSLMKNPADAADLTQEAFLRLLRVLPSYRGETRFTTWLYRLVVNLGLDELRRRRRPVSSLDADSGPYSREIEDQSMDSDPLARLTDQELAARVRQAVQTLPAGQRLALTLHYFEDLRYEDIAQVLGLPLNTIKSHIRRGKARLAQELAQYAPPALQSG